jgi:hypothetical protein
MCILNNTSSYNINNNNNIIIIIIIIPAILGTTHTHTHKKVLM